MYKELKFNYDELKNNFVTTTRQLQGEIINIKSLFPNNIKNVPQIKILISEQMKSK